MIIDMKHVAHGLTVDSFSIYYDLLHVDQTIVYVTVIYHTTEGWRMWWLFCRLLMIEASFLFAVHRCLF